MHQQTMGIHHITAFVTDAQDNVDFYAGVLGLRLVKKTINFDAPEVYHLYFGNEVGSPGTAITFFPWAGARRGRIGGVRSDSPRLSCRRARSPSGKSDCSNLTSRLPGQRGFLKSTSNLRIKTACNWRSSSGRRVPGVSGVRRRNAGQSHQRLRRRRALQ